ncbi:MAG: twin-arginine translocation signal domain-containing protein, partial [Bacteroidales bacterium]|nr:twin-arginine translocation signal domain-containing protein [Bacteroidales bacterium]
MNRRNFIGKAALGAGALTIIPSHVMAGKGRIMPNDRINLAYLGVGKQSYGLLGSINGCLETIVLAACDVDSIKLNNFRKEAEKANSKKLSGGKQAV